MLIKIFGVLDIISAVLLFLAIFIKIPVSIALAFVFYLIIKGSVFTILGGFVFFSVVSVLDIFSGILLYLSLSFTLPKILMALASLFLLQKGVFSLVPMY